MKLPRVFLLSLGWDACPSQGFPSSKFAASKVEVIKVDLHKEENREAHKTAKYEIEQLIIRRGQAFDITVTFNRGYSPKKDVIAVQFVTGKGYKQSKGGFVRLQIQDTENTLIPSKWGMQIKKASGNTVRLSIMSSAQAAIGYYDMIVETRSKDSSGKDSLQRYKHEEQICILFNTWCKDDVVYMENNKDLDLDVDEYVLKDTGHMWRGSPKWLSKKSWNFGQFKKVALESTLWLLEKAGLSPLAMSNAVMVVRTMTSMVNSFDRGGVLQGNWSGDYSGGTSPLKWNGSIEILNEFWKTKKAVKYGQCWVFSGLLTTLLRSLGMPTRSVTNFESGRDRDKSLTIDYYLTPDLTLIPEESDDYVWNFHVWNECWFERLDLPYGHDGWQALDSTPQETSGGFYQCGPASVNAIKKGEVYLNYDTDFIFAEVNADKVYWVYHPDIPPDPYYIDKRSIGKFISTQKPTKSGEKVERCDLTNYYKWPEGSIDERRVVNFVKRFSTIANIPLYEPRVKDVTCKLEVVDQFRIGDALMASVALKNKSNKRRTVTVRFTAILVYYTGRAARTLAESEMATIVLEPGEENNAKKEILPAGPDAGLLGGLVIPEGSIKVFLSGTVEETSQRFAIQDVVEFLKPELSIQIDPKTILVNSVLTVTASLTNPLSLDLTNGKFQFEVNNMEPETMVIDYKGPVLPNKTTEPGSQCNIHPVKTRMAWRLG